MATTDTPHDLRGVPVAPGDQLIDSRGRLFTAQPQAESIWKYGRSIAAAERKGVTLYYAAPILIKPESVSDLNLSAMSAKERSDLWHRLREEFKSVNA